MNHEIIRIFEEAIRIPASDIKEKSMNRNQGPSKICDVCIKFEFSHGSKNFKPENYKDQDVFVNL